MSCKAHEIKIRRLEPRFASVQEEDDVPEDRGPVQDLRELERLDQVHDAGDHAQRDRHVGTNTHTHNGRHQQRYTDILISVMCCVSRAMMMTACDLSAIAKPWEVQSKVLLDLYTWSSSYFALVVVVKWHSSLADIQLFTAIRNALVHRLQERLQKRGTGDKVDGK